ncbi:hypothetical protein CALCODRAFT_541165 [Calocera cornea HHB12733]|uniref:Uncharacterized protein n=1 Tax=Calocera cornea HHB12733 TaxID=1353952 RepID=A0A165G636_9BASI|nr:hypothetical protein CALCODRAFT_541165 [Calocera cornea HHB12733]
MARGGDYEAYIIVNGKRCPEYGTMGNPSKYRTTCIVQSSIGETFTVYWKDLCRSHTARGKVYVDGEHAASCVFNGGFVEVVCKGFCDGSSGHAKFCFGPAQLTDDESQALAYDEAFGTITLILEDGEWSENEGSTQVDDIDGLVEDEDDYDKDPDWTPPAESSNGDSNNDNNVKDEETETTEPINHRSGRRSTSCSQTQRDANRFRNEEYLKPVYEQNKKGCDHRVEAGVHVDEQETYYDFTPDGSPPVQFIFKYRSKEWMQANRFINAVPETFRSGPSEATYSDEDDPVLAKMIAERTALEAMIEQRKKDRELEKTRHEATQTRDRRNQASSQVKVEPSSSEAIVVPYLGEVIDLT